MYLKRFQIEGIKCFGTVELCFPHIGDDYSGWIVLLGGNGTGKSTLLQAVALALVGPLAGQRLLQPQGWIASSLDRGYGTLTAEIIKGEQDSQLGQPRKKPYEVNFAVTGNKSVELDGQPYDQPQLVHLATATTRKALLSGPYAAKRPGWFCCGYGPFRRLSGGDAAEARLVYSSGAEARFATLFRESAALTTCQDWLTQLYARSVDPNNSERAKSKSIYDKVCIIINHLLPENVCIERVDTSNVFFRTVANAVVAIPEMSDGYRSFLALAVDLLRHVVESNLDLDALLQVKENEAQVLVEGVVLIDEADAHLHPIWQRSLGFALRRVFPRVQFIVSTHSPFVAQAADKGGLIVLRPGDSGRVEATYPVESVQGWRVDQIMTSPLFGMNDTRDEETASLIREHADLVARRQWTELNQGERSHLAAVEVELSKRLTAPGDSLDEQKRQQEMARYVEETLQQLGKDK